MLEVAYSESFKCLVLKREKYRVSACRMCEFNVNFNSSVCDLPASVNLLDINFESRVLIVNK